MSRLWGGTERERQPQSDARWLELVKHHERELHRPCNIIGLLLAGIVIGASMVGILWLSIDEYTANHTTASGTPIIDHHSD